MCLPDSVRWRIDKNSKFANGSNSSTTLTSSDNWHCVPKTWSECSCRDIYSRVFLPQAMQHETSKHNRILYIQVHLEIFMLIKHRTQIELQQYFTNKRIIKWFATTQFQCVQCAASQFAKFSTIFLFDSIWRKWEYPGGFYFFFIFCYQIPAVRSYYSW